MKDAKLCFGFSTYRDGVISINVAVPGERIEIEVFPDERVDIARFRGSELDSTDPCLIDEMIEAFKD